MATYYISPTGVDAIGGSAGSQAAPWRTWTWSFANSTFGDTLMVMDGTYTFAQNGDFLLSKAAPANAPYTVRAVNERRCNIQGVNGARTQINIQNSSYIIIDGLRATGSVLYPASPLGNVCFTSNSPHCTFRRCLFSTNNRNYNLHLMQIGGSQTLQSNFTLIEECEFYFFHRHAIMFRYSDDCVVRRSYCHSRDFADLDPPAYQSGYNDYGDDFVTSYPGARNVVENCVCENVGALFSVQAIGNLYNSIDNKIMGCVGFGNSNSSPRLGGAARNDSGAVAGSTESMPRNDLYENCVLIQLNTTSIYERGCKNSMVNNCSIFNSAVSAITVDNNGGVSGDGFMSFFARNVLIVNPVGPTVTITADIDSWSCTNFNIYNGNATVPVTSNANGSFVNKTLINPNFGTVRCWVPDASPMKGAGVGGADIGANVLYRYETPVGAPTPVLTTTPLWDITTGEFPHGAIITGVNDTAATSCYNVHTRIGVNPANFPSGYGGAVPDTTPPAVPTGLQVT